MTQSDDFSLWGKQMVDFISNYLEHIDEHNVIPNVKPGYLRLALPSEAPEDPDTWPEIFKDVENYIIPGLTHWHHSRFHAYFPAANSVPSIMGDMLSAAFGCIGFSWAASPAITELELVMCDWIGKLLNLPEHFLHSSGIGGGVIQSSASDCLLISMLAARHQAIGRYKSQYDDVGEISAENVVLSKLVAYASTLAHSCVEKACMLSFVKLHQLEVNENFSIDGSALKKAIKKDKAAGFIPFYVCATIGTTACCSFDDLVSLGSVCKEFNLWLHVDGAYAGNAMICPEFRHYLDGIENVWSININPNKWMLVGFDCSLMWVRDSQALTQSMIVNPVYLQHKHSCKKLDLRHWGIPLSRRFRALKLWFVIRIYGAQGLREHIRRHVKLAALFAEKVRNDQRFEIIGQPVLGLVCFRLKNSNTLNQFLVRSINENRQIHMVPAVVDDIYFIRFAVCREKATRADIEYAWNAIQSSAHEILLSEKTLNHWYKSIFKVTNQLPSPSSSSPKLSPLLTSNLHVSSGCDNPTDVGQKVVIVDESSPTSLCEFDDLEDDKIIALANLRINELEQQQAIESCHILIDYMKQLGLDVKVEIGSRHGNREKDKTKRRKNNTDNADQDSTKYPSMSNPYSDDFKLENNGYIKSSTPKDDSKCQLFSSHSNLTASSFNSLQLQPKSVYKGIARYNCAKYPDKMFNQNLHNEAMICEEDLGVGNVDNSTLNRLRRHTLISMVSNSLSKNDSESATEEEMRFNGYNNTDYVEKCQSDTLNNMNDIKLNSNFKKLKSIRHPIMQLFQSKNHALSRSTSK